MKLHIHLGHCTSTVLAKAKFSKTLRAIKMELKQETFGVQLCTVLKLGTLQKLETDQK
jgi:hypothetical protein